MYTCLLDFFVQLLLLKVCNKLYMWNILGLQFIDIDTLGRGGKGVFTGTPPKKIIFCPFHKLAVSFYTFMSMNLA